MPAHRGNGNFLQADQLQNHPVKLGQHLVNLVGSMRRNIHSDGERFL